MQRIRQVREVILVRQTAEWKRDVRVQEKVMQYLASATYGAAGNKKGAKQASGMRILDDSDEQKRLPSVERLSNTFAVDPKYGVYTADEIEARAQEIRQQRDTA